MLLLLLLSTTKQTLSRAMHFLKYVTKESVKAVWEIFQLLATCFKSLHLTLPSKVAVRQVNQRQQ
jgi:hypothetical protein